MNFHRLKHSFTAGELSPILNDRVDFDRFKNGCKVLRNMVCNTQGPATRRPGFRFVYDLNLLGMDAVDPQVRMVPFIFNELQSYALVFFRHVDGSARMVLGVTLRDGWSGLVTGDGTDAPCVTADLPYTGSGDYDYTVPIDSSADIMVWHVAVDYTRTELALGVDYTVTVGDPNVVHVSWTASPVDGYLYIALKGVPTGEVVSLKLPDEWDIELFDWAQSADEMYIAQSGLPPHIIKRYDHSCWELTEITFTDQPEDWGPIGDAPNIIEQGWPAKVTFHQQRIAFAATLLRRQTIWLSKAGDFNDFGISSPVVDSDAVSFTLDSGTQNRIQWMLSGKSLHVGTLGNEWTVTGNTISSLTPENILAQRQTNKGSEPNKPLLVGITILFVERYGRTVNEFVYDYTYDSYTTSDMLILSPHLTEFYSIMDWTYQQTPDSIVWAVREDGDLMGVTYQNQHKVVGWHRHDTQGEFKAITSIPGSTREDDVWVTVLRVISGVDRYYLEKMEDWFKSDKAEDGRFLDGHMVYQGSPASIILGVMHLIGEEVSILADGTVHPPVVVDSTGRVQLDNEYSHVVIGLPYVSEVRPLLMDVALKDGTAVGRMKRIAKVDIDLYRSLGMTIGRFDSEDGDHEEDIPFRVPGDLTGQQVPLFGGVKSLNFPEGFDRTTEYFIRQKQPLPLTVLSVVDVVGVTK